MTRLTGLNGTIVSRSQTASPAPSRMPPTNLSPDSSQLGSSGASATARLHLAGADVRGVVEVGPRRRELRERLLLDRVAPVDERLGLVGAAAAQ